MATANPLQPRGGLLDMIGQGDSAFAGWLDPRRNAIINFGTGLIGADSARDAMRGAAQGLQTGRQQDTAYALLQQEQAVKQQALQEQAQQRNATLEYLQQAHPDLAQAVQGGLPIADAWRESFSRRGGSTADLTSDQRNFMMAQENPEFAEFLGIGAGPEPTDTQRNLEWRAQQAGLQPGTPEYQQFMMTGGSGGTSLSVGPDGSVQFTQGGGRPLTEQQSKDAVFATRAAGALEILDPIAGELTNPIARGVEGDPTGIARGALQSPQFQQANQAGLEFLQAILRKDTGAAITPQEQTEYGRVYLPQPGDSPQVLEQKQLSRIRAVEALRAGMAPQAILNMELALQRSGGAAVAPSGTTSSGVPWSIE